MICSLPDELLPNIFAFIPNHLELRSVSHQFDHAVHVLHSSGLCSECCCYCKTASALSSIYARVPWMKEWKINIDYTQDDLSYPSFGDDSITMEPIRLFLSQLQSDSESTPLHAMDSTNSIHLHLQISERDNDPEFSLITTHQLLQIAEWCMNNSIPNQCKILTSVTESENGFSSLKAFQKVITHPSMNHIHALDLAVDENVARREVMGEIMHIAISSLSSAPHCSSLRALTLSMFGTKSATILGESMFITRLTELELALLDTDTFDIIVNSPIVKRLKKLSFNYLSDANEALRSVSFSPFLSKLSKLVLSHNPDLKEQGVRYLTLPASRLSSLNHLDLSHVGNLPLSAIYVLCSPGSHLKSLKYLDLANAANDSPVKGTDVMTSLCTSPNFQFLTHLGLSYMQYIDEECAKILANSGSTFPCLESLDLDNTTIGLGGLTLCSASSCNLNCLAAISMAEVRELDASFVRGLTRVELLPQLKYISIGLSNDDLTSLGEKYPNLIID